MFTSLVMPGYKKLIRSTDAGVREYLIRKKPKPGIHIFEEKGIYAEPIREAELWEREEYFNQLELPRINVIPVTKTSVWFTMPLNDNQIVKHFKYTTPLPLLFTPDNISVLDPINARVFKYRRMNLLFENLNYRYNMDYVQVARDKAAELTRSNLNLADELPIPLELRRAVKFIAESNVPPLEQMVRHALQVAGAVFVDLVDLGNNQYQVNYEYKQARNNVIIDDTLFVLDAGICLTDHRTDRDTTHDHDLASIVFVKSNNRRWL